MMPSFDKYDEESLGGTTVAQIFKKFAEMKNQCDEKRSDCIFCQKFLGEMQNMVKEFKNLVFQVFSF
ncbi:unnamed protein product [Camellia sinensis]